MARKWVTPLGVSVRLVKVSANVSLYHLLETLLDHADSDDFDPGEFSGWQAERLEQLVAKIRESQEPRPCDR